ncbi:MadR family response regulator transcription factor [Sciscionella sediminilitoris]|uniref:MadR family response regulator transcription factor n=1 Tax=Sciscionella sediminilitoris TaxID=1445613 RepID=UPI0009E81209
MTMTREPAPNTGAHGTVAPHRILLVDDHAIVRQGLRTILDREPDLCVVGEASTANEAIGVLEQTNPQIVLLDLKLSTGSDTEGLALCADLTMRRPELRVLVLTTFLDDPLVVEAIQNGASGYVIKDVDTTDLIRSIRAIARNETAFDSRSANAMARSIQATPEPLALTQKERNVLQLLAHGMRNREIGLQLYVSETTVKFHVRNILRKLAVSSRAEAVYEASKIGLI